MGALLWLWVLLTPSVAVLVDVASVDATGGSCSGSNWQDTSKILGVGNAYCDPSPSCPPVECSGFAFFGVSAPRVVSGVIVRIEKETDDSVGPPSDKTIALALSGVEGVNRALGGNWPNSPAYISHGSSTDLWGITWNVANLNTLKVIMEVQYAGEAKKANIHDLELTMYHALDMQISSIAPFTGRAGDSVTISGDFPSFGTKTCVVGSSKFPPASSNANTVICMMPAKPSSTWVYTVEVEYEGESTDNGYTFRYEGCGSGFVDAGEDCDSAEACCDACAFRPSSFVCRAGSLIACDRDELCTGSAETCPLDTRHPVGETCRAANGLCDAEETCGPSGSCPADDVLAAETVCRIAADECDVPEVCDGSLKSCPFDYRETTGACDKCPSISTPPVNGALGSCASVVVEDGATCSFLCDTDYVLFGAAMVCEGNTWTTMQTCTAPCVLAAPTNGGLGTCAAVGSTPEILPSGSECEFTCDTGFVKIGDRVRCTNGALAGSQTCEAPCSPLTTVPNGLPGTCGSEIPSAGTCGITCNTGYSVTGAPQVCRDGSFLSLQTCGSPCPEPPAPTNGGIGTCAGGVPSGSTCVFTCNEGYRREGAPMPCVDSSISTLQECLIGSCAELAGAIDEQGISIGVWPSVPVGEVATVGCLAGVYEGVVTRDCTTGGVWGTNITGNCTAIPVVESAPITEDGGGGSSGGTVAVLVIVFLLIICCIVAGGVLLLNKTKKKKAKPIRKPDFTHFQYAGMTEMVVPRDLAETVKICRDIQPLIVDPFVSAGIASVDSAEFEVFARSVYFLTAPRNGRTVLESVLTKEIQECHSAGTLFRTNSLGTKIMATHARAVGMDFLWNSVGLEVCTYLRENQTGDAADADATNSFLNTADLEINPNKVDAQGDIEVNKYVLMAVAQKFFNSIINATASCPLSIRQVCALLRTEAMRRFPDDPKTAQRSICGFLFLRLFCPAISTPESAGLAHTVSPDVRKQLINVCKVMQNLANGVEFGKKEAHLTPMNDFVLSNQERLAAYCDSITDISANNLASPFPPLEVPELVTQMCCVRMTGLCAQWIQKPQYEELLAVAPAVALKQNAPPPTSVPEAAEDDVPLEPVPASASLPGSATLLDQVKEVVTRAGKVPPVSAFKKITKK